MFNIYYKDTESQKVSQKYICDNKISMRNVYIYFFLRERLTDTSLRSILLKY